MKRTGFKRAEPAQRSKPTLTPRAEPAHAVIRKADSKTFAKDFAKNTHEKSTACEEASQKQTKNCEVLADLRRPDGRARLTVSIPKGLKAKPGKRPPTKAEAEWMNSITELGCIACRIDGHPTTPGAVHHLLRGGVRMGHLHTICLCDPGHHQDGAGFGKVSRHPWKARFEAKYGTEQELLAMTMKMISGDEA